jgi:hypothetical protein
LGELFYGRDPKRSAAEHQEALSIRQALRQQETNPLEWDIAHLNSLLDSQDEGDGPEAQINDIKTMTNMRDAILQRLVADPAAIYELCCELNIPGPRLRDAALEDSAEKE